jgi:hypothetical protein
VLNFEYVQHTACGKLDKFWRRRHNITENETQILVIKILRFWIPQNKSKFFISFSKNRGIISEPAELMETSQS